MIRDIKADTPEVPHAYEPEWDVWCREIERFDITPDTTLIGHSAGAGFWIKYLSVNQQLMIDKLILVAPWLDPDSTIANKDFFKFKLDSELGKRTKKIVLCNASDDSASVQQTVARIKQEVKGIEVQEFPEGYGHFTYENLKTIEFPELRDIVLGMANV